MAWVTIVAVLALIQYTAFGMLVGKARMTYKIDAPAVHGDPVFERYYRVHMNTLESLLFFLPSLFLFVQYFNPLLGAGLGAVFLIGRQLYFFSYIKDPASRGPGFALTLLPSLFMAIGAAAGAIQSML
ncbi:MAPEG family protein [Pseudohongiella spirulinae]|uniref:Membrane protein n=1 Tax=Pseudohongiella spirulinae TaxID=1249552 RepID=A0A0S2KCE1_9GAMM|nr:MAPEG family protein [Pseudohongiella spirulinae]ALO45845.1 membrane protein [Pseudohongiella spirulinae]